MKIVFINDTFLLGRGADTVIYELAKRLGEKHEVFVIAFKTNFREDNFKIIKIKGRKLVTGNNFKDSFFFFSNIIQLRKTIKKIYIKNKIDVFNVHHSALNLAMRGFPTIITWHGSPPSKNFLRVGLNKLALKGLKTNPFSIVVSKYLKSKLSENISENKIRTIYNGVSEEFKVIGKDKGFMFFVGRLEIHKNIHQLIKLSKETNFPLKIAGSGSLESKLKNYAKKIKADRVFFLGKIPRKDLIKNYQECSFFVSASKWEGFGLIFMEAASCGKPSVAYRVGSLPEIILKNNTGFLVNSYDDLKEKTMKLIKDKKLRRKMGKGALNHSKNFSWKKASEEYEKILRLAHVS